MVTDVEMGILGYLAENSESENIRNILDIVTDLFGNLDYDQYYGMTDSEQEAFLAPYLKNIDKVSHIEHFFKVGDKVKIPYISDGNPHNNMIGVITRLNPYTYYPNPDANFTEKRYEGTIVYPDGLEESVSDFYRDRSGIASEVVFVSDEKQLDEISSDLFSDREINDEENSTIPYKVRIEEIYSKNVVVLAADPYEAESMADCFCSEGDINLDYDNFTDRTCSCNSKAQHIDLKLHDVYNMEGEKLSRKQIEEMFFSSSKTEHTKSMSLEEPDRAL